MKLSIKLDHLNQCLAAEVQSLGFELLGCELLGGAKSPLLRVYIDKVGGVTIDDCGQISRQIAALIDVERVFLHPCQLEVSSPGERRPLFKLSHYEQVVGQRIWVSLREGMAGRHRYTGQLESVGDDFIEMTVDGEIVRIAYADIARAHLAPRAQKRAHRC